MTTGPLPTFAEHLQRVNESKQADEPRVGGAIPLDAYPGSTKLAATLFNKYAIMLTMDTRVTLPSSSGKRLAAMLRKEGCPQQDSLLNGYKIGSFFEFGSEYHEGNFILFPPHESDRGGEWRLEGRQRGWGCTSAYPEYPTRKGRDARDDENYRRRKDGRAPLR